MTTTNRKPARRKRKGAAVAELAICLPAMVLLVLGAIECTSMIFLRQSLAITAYEGVRTAIKSDATTADVEARCNQVLSERNINGASVAFTPSNTGAASRGQEIRVEAIAPCAPNSILPLQFFGGNLDAAATMIKE